MTERTALLLASLSHRWFFVVLLLPIVFGVATSIAGVLQTRARAAGANAPTQRGCMVARVASSTLLAASIAVFVVAFFHVGCASLKAHSVQCLSNIKQLAMGALVYSQDFDDHLPIATHWSEAIGSRVQEAVRSNPSADGDPFRCPAAESPASYGMNKALDHMSMSNIASPMDTVMLFDADAPIRSFAGGSRDVARTRHSGVPSVAFADGHAKGANAFALARLNWAPAQPIARRGTIP